MSTRPPSVLSIVVEGATEYRNYYLFTRTLQEQPSLPEAFYHQYLKKHVYEVFLFQKDKTECCTRLRTINAVHHPVIGRT